jgi:hypothetical protein
MDDNSVFFQFYFVNFFFSAIILDYINPNNDKRIFSHEKSGVTR